MHYLEGGGECGYDVFKEGEHYRLLPGELHVDEMHMLMMSVRKRNHMIAAKKPTTVREVTQVDSGLYAVRFDMLNKDYSNMFTVACTMNTEGYFEDPEILRFRGRRVDAAYFVGYSDGLDDYWQRVSASWTAEHSGQLTAV